MGAFCCNCKTVTQHKYHAFSQEQPANETATRGFLSGLFYAIASALMEGAASGDYKCTKCGTYLNTPDNLD
ncbi:hypothetical protein [Vibrio sp. 16]|uniref:hypothetical protein n=1 Tax=Vibrio sp. 16 TaxID=391586 RepID=UPI00018F2BBE|nr:hypothetical protein [Vibrio sp. 16]EED28544.1 hypothetical protein VPMS16_96 [Vibrio sp. 16]